MNDQQKSDVLQGWLEEDLEPLLEQAKQLNYSDSELMRLLGDVRRGFQAHVGFLQTMLLREQRKAEAEQLYLADFSNGRQPDLFEIEF